MVVQAKRSERDGYDGLVRERRAAGRVDQERKHARGRDHGGQTQNGRGQVLRRPVQQQRSSRRSVKSPNPGTGTDVQDGRRQVHVSVVQSKCAVPVLRTRLGRMFSNLVLLRSIFSPRRSGSPAPDDITVNDRR